jgi:hypothetical protein
MQHALHVFDPLNLGGLSNTASILLPLLAALSPASLISLAFLYVSPLLVCSTPIRSFQFTKSHIQCLSVYT